MYVRFFGPTKLYLNKNNWWISVSWVHWQVSDHISLLWNLLSEQCLKQTNCKEKKSVFCVVLIVQLFYRHFKCNLFLNCRLKKQKKHVNTACPVHYFGETLFFWKMFYRLWKVKVDAFQIHIMLSWSIILQNVIALILRNELSLTLIQP